MKQILIILVILTIAAFSPLQAQKYFTRSGAISFFSKALMEDIEAHNTKATSVLDAKTGSMQFAVLIKAFQFEKALMQEHFNENYLESDKYPKAIFRGKILNIDDVDFENDGTYPVKVKGKMTIHGITNTVAATGKIIIEEGAISAKSKFKVTVANYKIRIPKVVRDNIAKVVEVRVDLNYKALKKKIASR